MLLKGNIGPPQGEGEGEGGGEQSGGAFKEMRTDDHY